MNTSMDILGVKYEFGPSVFYLFGPSVKNSVLRFSINCFVIVGGPTDFHGVDECNTLWTNVKVKLEKGIKNIFF